MGRLQVVHRMATWIPVGGSLAVGEIWWVEAAVGEGKFSGQHRNGPQTTFISHRHVVWPQLVPPISSVPGEPRATPDPGGALGECTDMISETHRWLLVGRKWG